MARTRRHERRSRARILRDEGGEDILADFVAPGTGRRSDPRHEVRGRCAHGRQRRLQHALRQPRPAGVRGRDLAAVLRREHHRQAVGGEDGQHHAPRRRDERVGDGLRCSGIGRHVHAHDIRAMHLLQPVRRRRQAGQFGQLRAVARHRGRIVAVGRVLVAQVEVVERRLRHARAMAQRGERVHAPRRGPGGLHDGRTIHLRCACVSARRAASSASMSAGTGAVTRTGSPLTGWANSSVSACRA